MEQIMNDYEDIYKYKSDNLFTNNDEVSSLNNNFSLEENQRDLEILDLFQDSTKNQSSGFEYKSDEFSVFDKEESQENNEADLPFEFGSTNEEQNTGLGAKCQKDIRIEEDPFAQFGLKDNKLTMGIRNQSCCGDSVKDKDCQPFELNFPFFDSPAKEDLQIKAIDDEIKNMEKWVDSLIGEHQHQEDDIVVDQPESEKFPEAKELDISEHNGKISNFEEPENEAHEVANNCGFRDYAALYSGSQNQAFFNALEGKVESSTKTKGTSDKELNALSIRRSCFRALSSFLKQTFSKFNRAWQEKKRNKKKTKDMDELINIYMVQEFGALLSGLNEEFTSKLREALIAILHSHRYKKMEGFTKDIDFSIIRDVLYSYTLDARDRFMKDPTYALIFHHFFIKGAYKFLLSKVQCKPKLYVFELEKEIVSLHKDAVITLKN